MVLLHYVLGRMVKARDTVVGKRVTVHGTMGLEVRYHSFSSGT